jgi:hypothetical protein
MSNAHRSVVLVLLVGFLVGISDSADATGGGKKKKPTTDANKKAEDKETAMPSAKDIKKAEDLANKLRDRGTALALAAYGRLHKMPSALITAAEILNKTRIAFPEMVDESPGAAEKKQTNTNPGTGKTVPDTGEEAKDALNNPKRLVKQQTEGVGIPLKNAVEEAKELLNDARQLIEDQKIKFSAKEAAALRTDIARVESQLIGKRGHIPGPFGVQRTIPPGATHHYTLQFASYLPAMVQLATPDVPLVLTINGPGISVEDSGIVTRGGWMVPAGVGGNNRYEVRVQNRSKNTATMYQLITN